MENQESKNPSWWNLWAWYKINPRAILMLLYAIGILLRWWDLAGSRPIHHDESLHGMYSLYGFDRPDQNFYKYQPLLHGPLLFNSIPWAFDLLGTTDFAIRFPMAMMGTLMLFLPFFFRRYLGPLMVFGLTLFIAISPELVFWSRFSREDYYMVWSLICMLAGATLAPASLAPIIVWFGFAWMMCVKEASFVFIAIFLGYLIFEFFICKVVKVSEKNEKPLLITQIKKNFQAHPWSWVVGFALAAFVYSYLYSAGFQYAEGILDGLYRKSLVYWWNQHSIERIKGPFSYAFFVISWYDLPWTVALILLQIHFYFSRGARWKVFFLVMIAVSAILSLLSSGMNFESTFILNLFKLKIPFDVFLCLFILINSIVTTTMHLKDQQKNLAFFGYWFWANFFTFGYLGEKVPWLALYPFISGLIYFALYFQHSLKNQILIEKIMTQNEVSLKNIFQFSGAIILIISIICGLEEREPKMTSGALVGILLYALGIFADKKLQLPPICLKGIVCTLFLVFGLRSTIMTNFGRAGEQHQFIGQVHTTWEMHNILKEIRRQYFTPSKGQRPSIYLQGDALWPVTWYLHSIPTYRFVRDEQTTASYEYAFLNLGDGQADIFRRTHYEQIIPLRGWWVPDYSLMTLRKFLLYTFFHLEWNPIGNFNVHFFTRKAQTNATNS